MKVLILAGGYGTRLYPLVKDIPKALLEVNGKTLIDYVMDKLDVVENIEEVVIVTNEKFYSVLSSWADKKNFKAPIKMVNDKTTTPEDRLGAVGDMQFIFDQEEQECDWLVLGSDNIFDYAIDGFVREASMKNDYVTIGLYDLESMDTASMYGVVEIDRESKVTSFEEKPENPKSSLITMCLYYFPSNTLKNIKLFLDATGSRDAAGGYIQWLYKESDVYGFKFQGRWYDIGSIESYQEAQQYF